MNFFEQQAKARSTSSRLVVLFALAVAGIVLAVDLAVAVFLGVHWGVLGFTTLVTLAVIGLGSLYRMASLRGGGDAVALQFGGVPVPEETSDRNLRRLRNVVEEIAIASGVPVPKLYVLEDEAAINAFAAGYSPSDAAIAVTRGALDRLNRDELQGVIAHEFSHVLNGDMRLNIRLIGVLFGILMISLIGRKILWLGGGRSRNGAAVMVAALVALAVGSIGLLFGRMIKASVSRTRERLADASAVQFTRQTSGLAGALKKIAGLPAGARLNDRADAEEASHMLFGDGVGFSGLFATHPPLLERIQALEPSFRADQLEHLRVQWMVAAPSGLEEDVRLGLDSQAGGLPARDARINVTPPMVAAQVANPEPGDYLRADAIARSMPASLRALAQSRETVVPLLLGLLLDADDTLRTRQATEASARLGHAVADAATALQRGELAGLHPMLRLPLVAIAFPVLRRRPRPELESILDTVHAMVHCDGRVSLFEYCMARLLEVQLRESLDPRRHARFGRRKPGSVREEFATLLAVVAQAGNPSDRAEAQRAYLAGLQRVLPRDHLPYAPPADGVLALDDVWPALDGLEPLAKQMMVEAVTAAASHDGRISVAEAELLRTICAVLHCPLPPMLEHG
ncbi:M48 family metallopeptidase [Luteimonas sp. MC1782]|uniref:M48 family metallopeptidase n=1 Tax=Luteimonas sp. MC1782 TaxID=2760305 RepID=UPI001600CABE|nr:M48 family metallopeptidase [Luteimonas sp. MC1782]MBB1472789.1 M48 family metallopeptidase [Luteimonas sp. MC1782]